MLRLSLILAATIISALPAAAFDAADRNAVTQEVAGFEKAVEEKRYAVFFETVPPRMMQEIAGQAGLSVDKLEGVMERQITKAMASATLLSFDMDLGAMTTGTTPAGRAYAMIPTRSVMKTPDLGEVRATNTTLALKDGAEWYLVRIDSPTQLATLRKVYPDFTKVAFPEGRIEAVD